MGSGLTVGEWWERWFPAQDLAPSKLESYAQQYHRHVGPWFGDLPLDEATGSVLSGFARHLREGGLAPSSVTVALSVVRDLLADAAAEGLILAAPTSRTRHRRIGAVRTVRAGVVVDAGIVARALCMTRAASHASCRWRSGPAMHKCFSGPLS
jgi:hypothetical protein